jgi:hypothetical protein
MAAMAFDSWKFERLVYRTLRRFAQQRVRTILKPGNVWVVDRAIKAHDDLDAALATCQMRGWIEVLLDNVPHGRLGPNASLPSQLFDGEASLYRLTDAGWAAIHRAHLWNLVSVGIAVLSLIAAVAAIACASS